MTDSDEAFALDGSGFSACETGGVRSQDARIFSASSEVRMSEASMLRPWVATGELTVDSGDDSTIFFETLVSGDSVHFSGLMGGLTRVISDTVFLENLADIASGMMTR